jgi:hypothetical protein
MKPLALLAALLLSGCAINNPNRIVIVSGTVLGIELGENPATQLYHARLGYVRSEVALVPSTNGLAPDVLLEANYGRLFTRDASLRQRLAVGRNAVGQPGAFLLFATSKDGTVDSNAAAIAKSLTSIPSPDASATAALLPLAKAYEASDKKPEFDTVAMLRGYQNFSDFLGQGNLTTEQVAIMAADLKAKNLLP